MIKNTRLFLISLAIIASSVVHAQYCVMGGPSSGVDSNVEDVELIGESTTINYTGCLEDPDGGVIGVEDMTSEIADIVIGSTYTIDVTWGSCGIDNDYVGNVWIDFDGDMEFDAFEVIGTVDVPGGGAITENYEFTVPLDAAIGTYRLRIMQEEGGTLPLDPCASFAAGSVTDFNVLIEDVTYCGGGPSEIWDGNLYDAELIGETSTIGYDGCPGITGVEDETDEVADLIAGSTYELDIIWGTCGGSNDFVGTVWIDYNGNGVFDSDEVIGVETGFGFAYATYEFTVPLEVLNGETRMRVMLRQGGSLPLNPCSYFTWGSVTDFTIDISGGATYCDEAGPLTTINTNVEEVELMGETATINYTGCVDGGILGVEYVDTETADLITGLTYSLSINWGTCGIDSDYVGSVWIDFDGDIEFDVSEVIGTVDVPGGGLSIETYEFTVPVDAATGNYRLRVMQEEGGVLPLDPCASYDAGSVTDFTVSINEFGYCGGGPSSSLDSNIEEVELIGGSSTIVYDGCPGVIGVEDQTAEVADLVLGITYDLDITWGTCGSDYDYVGTAWIDYDGNGIFESDEIVATVEYDDGTLFESYEFTPPLWATEGEQRMRIMQYENGSLPLNPCAEFDYGSVVDFTIDLIYVCDPEPGVDGSIDICISEESVDMMTVITPGEIFGFWSLDGTEIDGDVFDFSDLEPGIYELYYIVTGSCSTDSTLGTVTVLDLPEVEANADETDICYGHDVTFTGSGATSYDWDDFEDGATVTPPIGVTSYTVVGTDDFGCSNEATIEITVTEVIDITTSFTNVLTVDDGTIDITVSGGTPDYSFDWDNDGTGDFDDTQNLEDLAEGTYAVVVMDNVGCLGEAEITLISELSLSEQDKFGVNIYPNPTNGIINISFIQNKQEFRYELFDLTGRKIMNEGVTKANPEGLTIDLNAYESGTYFIRLISGNLEKTYKIVLN